VFEVKSFYRALSPSMSFSFPWKNIWRSKARPRVALFAWTATHGKILTVDNLRKKGMVLVIDVACAKRMGNRLIIFFSIVGQRELCGMLSSPGLAFVGLCLVRSMSYWLAGGRVNAPRALLCGKWSLSVLFGVFGVSETLDVLRTPRGLLRIFSTFFFLLFSPGQWVGWPQG
jgi:hypothetical protein